jgi:hypothetical protein
MSAVAVFILIASLLLQPDPTLTPLNPGDITAPPTPTFAPDNADLLDEVVSARFEASTYAPLVGEPFTLVISVILPDGAQLNQWPEFPETWEPFQVIERRELQEQQIGGRVGYEQEIEVILWRPGGIDTPQTFVGYTFGGGDRFNVPVRSAFIAVPSVLDTDDLNLRPFQPPVDLPYLSPWLILGALIAAGMVAWLVLRRWRSRPKTTVELAQQSPYERAAATLEVVRENDLPSVETSYQLVAGVLRTYLQTRLSVPAPELTTDETLDQLAGRIPEPLLADLERMLSRSDMVKFAGASPDERSIPNLIEYAGRWLEAVERQVKANGSETETTNISEGQGV